MNSIKIKELKLFIVSVLRHTYDDNLKARPKLSIRDVKVFNEDKYNIWLKIDRCGWVSELECPKRYWRNEYETK